MPLERNDFLRANTSVVTGGGGERCADVVVVDVHVMHIRDFSLSNVHSFSSHCSLRRYLLERVRFTGIRPKGNRSGGVARKTFASKFSLQQHTVVRVTCARMCRECGGWGLEGSVCVSVCDEKTLGIP